jgi:hypothetical protein
MRFAKIEAQGLAPRRGSSEGITFGHGRPGVEHGRRVSPLSALQEWLPRGAPCAADRIEGRARSSREMPTVNEPSQIELAALIVSVALAGGVLCMAVWLIRRAPGR